ncbi:hypothetical protein UFOVP817_32 [uncultured Caudovirales phage]|uniref:Uncharacterized protein n=1 Tax=uncultured Caudovirales phage TaxID=2100421 RepID=A0A6J5P6M3_9CAUD|nr:hypothetical protein UFOVP817_32 [uncultured Caudovirales phage]
MCVFTPALSVHGHHDIITMETKTLKISEPIHSQLRVSAAQQKQSIQSLAESFITHGIASLLARKQSATGNPLRIRKGERV